MGILTRLRAVVDPWGVRADWLNANVPGINVDRKRAKQITLASRAWSEGRRGGVPRDRMGRPIGLFDAGPRTTLMQDSTTLRREGKILARYNPHARHAVRQIVNSVISNGINIKPTGRTKTLHALVNSTFLQSFENSNELDTRRRMNFHQLSRFWLKTRLEMGGVFIRIRPRKSSDNLAVPIALQTMNYDYLYTGPKPDIVKEGHSYANGIEFDPLGEEYRFYFYRSHPDDTPNGYGYDNVTPVLKYAPDGTQQVIHWFEPFQDDDHIGMPRGCIVYQTLTRKMDYDFSILDRKRIESKRIGVWEADHSADPGDNPARNSPTEWVDEYGEVHYGPPPGAEETSSITWAEAQDWVNSQGGSAVDNGEHLVSPPGYKFKPYEVANFNDHPAFSEGMLREIAVGFFAPEWLVTGDLRKLSFAGGELGLLYWQEDCKAECEDFICNVFLPIWNAWVRAGERKGLWNAKDITVAARQNRMPKRDLLKDIKTLVTGIENRLIAREDAIAELGKDTIEEVNAKIVRDIEWAKANGVNAVLELYGAGLPAADSGNGLAKSMKALIAQAITDALEGQDPDQTVLDEPSSD